MITPQNVIRHELIGLRVRVADSPNPRQLGLGGTVIDETKHMLVIMTRNGVKRIQKKFTLFELHLPDDTHVIVDGSVLVMQPEKRIGMRIKR